MSLPKKNKTVVLMYHGIVSPNARIPQDRESGAELYDLKVDTFRKQMAFLAQRQYSGVLCGEPFDKSNKQQVIITFDDGELNNFTEALPILMEHQIPAYFFVTVNRVEREGYMDWEHLKELRDCGMVIGSHGLNHGILTELKDKDLERELIESKDQLERNLSVNIDSFSVPRGFYDDRVLKIAEEIGYKYIFVSKRHPRHTQCWGRVAVKGDWTVQRFEQALQDKTPLGEKIFDICKGVTKRILGGRRYDQIRERLIK